MRRSACCTNRQAGSISSSFIRPTRGQNAFLANEGINLLNAWLNTGMAEPYVMASAVWGSPPVSECIMPGTPQNLLATGGKRSVTLNWTASVPAPGTGYRVYYDQGGKILFRADVGPQVTTYQDKGLSKNTRYCYVVTSWTDCNGNGIFDPGVDKESTPSAPACATAQ
jgi:hypothetical protein